MWQLLTYNIITRNKKGSCLHKLKQDAMTDIVVCDYDGLECFFHFSPLVFSPQLPKILGAAEICSADGSLAFYISLEGLGKNLAHSASHSAASAKLSKRNKESMQWYNMDSQSSPPFPDSSK